MPPQPISGACLHTERGRRGAYYQALGHLLTQERKAAATELRVSQSDQLDMQLEQWRWEHYH